MEVTLIVSTVASIFEEIIHAVAGESSQNITGKKQLEIEGVIDLEITDDYWYTILVILAKTIPWKEMLFLRNAICLT